MKNFLIVDTTTPVLKIAIHCNGKDFLNDISQGFNHLENLIPLIDKGMKEINADKKSLDFLVVCTGPGSFTGIRIGIATMQAIGFALKIPVFGVDSFNIYRLLINDNDSIIVPLIDAKKKCFYTAFINSVDDKMYDIPVSEIIKKLTQHNDRSIIVVGKDFSLMKEAFDQTSIQYKWDFQKDFLASDLLEYVKKKFVGSSLSEYPIVEIEPVYLRQSEAEIALNIKMAEQNIPK